MEEVRECNCHDFKREAKDKTFWWENGSWSMTNNNLDVVRIYYCPMCGGKLVRPNNEHI